MSEIFDLFSHLGDRLLDLYKILTIVGDRFKNNVGETITTLTPQKMIRLVIILGAYALLRPYIIKLGAKVQLNQMEKDSKEAAKISPNDMRGLYMPEVEEDDDNDEEKSAAATATDWGKVARARQRRILKNLVDVEEKRLKDLHGDDDDKDIEEFLVG